MSGIFPSYDALRKLPRLNFPFPADVAHRSASFSENAIDRGCAGCSIDKRLPHENVGGPLERPWMAPPSIALHAFLFLSAGIHARSRRDRSWIDPGWAELEPVC